MMDDTDPYFVVTVAVVLVVAFILIGAFLLGILWIANGAGAIP
jgi:hypothetical protein